MHIGYHDSDHENVTSLFFTGEVFLSSCSFSKGSDDGEIGDEGDGDGDIVREIRVGRLGGLCEIAPIRG